MSIDVPPAPVDKATLTAAKTLERHVGRWLAHNPTATSVSLGDETTKPHPQPVQLELEALMRKVHPRAAVVVEGDVTTLYLEGAPPPAPEAA